MSNFPRIPFAKPDIGPEEEEAAIRVLRSSWLTTGSETLAFEKEFCDMTKSPFALAVNSATSGLHLALEALNIQTNDTIAVCPYTFTASCEVMRYLGAHPLFIDCAPDNFHMDPKKLLEKLKSLKAHNLPLPQAIMPVHIGGVSPDLKAIYEIGKEFKIPILEDAAHAFPARNREDDAFLGTEADIAVYSFYANKTITTGEGGMVICKDENLAKRMKVMRSHGIDRDVWHRFTTKAQQWEYAVVEPGFKYNLPDILGAIGREQLKKADRFMENRRRIAALYYAGLKGIKNIILPPFADEAHKNKKDHSWHLFTVRISGEHNMEKRNSMISALSKEGIGTSVHYIPLHIMPYYANTYKLKPSDFPNAHKAYEGALSLPLYSGLSDESVAEVIDHVKELIRD